MPMRSEPSGVAGLLETVAGQARGLGRDDLADVLSRTERDLDDAPFPVVVIGEHGKGRSALVNALVGVPVCGVSALQSTAVPTIVCHGDKPEAALVRHGSHGEPIPLAAGARHALTGVDQAGHPISAVEVHLPRELLRKGLVLVDTPGIGGGFAGASAAATLRGVTHSAAMLFVTDAAQELTAPELDLLRRAMDACSTAALVVTKIDLYPQWRQIVALDTAMVHEFAPGLPVIPVSATLRELALATFDPSLEAECGYSVLVSLLTGPLRARRQAIQAREAAESAVEVLHELSDQLLAERGPLADPGHENDYLATLEGEVARSERLIHAATEWRELLADEIRGMRRAVTADLTRTARELEQTATQRIEISDPGRNWGDFQAWVQGQANKSLTLHHESLLRRVDAVIASMSSALGDQQQPPGTEALRGKPTSNSPDRLTIRPMSALEFGMHAARGLSLSGYISFVAGTIVYSVGIVSSATLVALPLTGLLGATFAGRAVAGAREAQQKAARAEALNATRTWLARLVADTARSDEELQDLVYRNLRDHFGQVATRCHGDAQARFGRSRVRVQARGFEPSDPADRGGRPAGVAAELRAERAGRVDAARRAGDTRRDRRAGRGGGCGRPRWGGSGGGSVNGYTFTSGSAVRGLLSDAEHVYAGTEWAPRFAAARDDLDGPLRVAIGGPVSAGKSTLLNALIGARVAPTDAGECTRILTWYGHGEVERAWGVPLEDPCGRVELGVAWEQGRLQVYLGDRHAEDWLRVHVELPTPALEGLVLVDTPGMSSSTVSLGARSRGFMTGRGTDNVPPPDAIVYLMRRLHANDVDFLEAFRDPQARGVPPVNALAVLSRADEIGGGRTDAMALAAEVSACYARDARVRSLALTVVPVAGLIAEAAATLQPREYTELAALAALPEPVTASLLLSAERFCAPRKYVPVPAERRRELALRLGMVGLRWSLDLIRTGRGRDPDRLAVALAHVSGLPAVQAMLRGQITGRREVLKTDAALRLLQRATSEAPVAGCNALLDRAEQVRVCVNGFDEVRLLADLRLGVIGVDERAQQRMERLLGVEGAALQARLGLSLDAPADDVLKALLTEHAYWQIAQLDPLSTRQKIRAASVLQRTCEGLRDRFLADA